MDDLNLAESLDPTGFRVALLKALAYRRRRLVTEGLEQFNHVLQRYRASDILNADDIGIIHNSMGVMLAKMFSESGDTNEKNRILNLRHAFVHFQKAAQRPTIRHVAMQNAGQVLTQLGRFNEALSAFEQSASTGFQDPLVTNNFAVALQRCGSTLQALRWMRLALACDPDHPVANYNLGAVLTLMGSWRDAISALDRSQKISQNTSTYNNRGVCFHALGQFEEAIADYSQAIALSPGCLAPRWNRILANAIRMNFRMALWDITMMRGQLNDDAGNYNAILDRLTAYCQSWQFAFRVLTSQMLLALQNLPPLSLVDLHHTAKGIVLDTTLCDPKKFGIFSSPEHRELMESVTKICDRALTTLVLDACRNQAQHKIDRVLVLLMQAVYSVTDDVLRAQLIAWRCVLLTQSNNLEAVEAEIAPLLASKTVLTPPYSGIINLAGVIRQSQGDTDRALSLFALAHRIDPANVFPLMNSALCHQQTEHHFEAFQLAAKSIAILLHSSALTKTQQILVETLHTYAITIQSGTKQWNELEKTQSVLAKALHDVVHDSHNAHHIYNIARQVDQVIEEYLDSFDTVLNRQGLLEDHNTEHLDATLTASLAKMQHAFRENDPLKERRK